MRYIIQKLNEGLIHSFYSSAKQYSLAINHLNNQRYFSTKKPLLDMTERRFADPTYDDTFRRLFGEEAHKNILVNALNSFLGFTEENVIIDVEINNPALEKRKIFGSNPSITGAIDILCITNNNKKIVVEMQGKKTA